jgi:prefoldin subunit 5
MEDKKSLEEVLEEIRIITPELENAGKSSEALLTALKELQKQEGKTKESLDSIAYSAELISSKLEAVEENEEAMQLLFERVREVKKSFEKKSLANTIMVGVVAIFAFMLGSYTDYLNLKKNGFETLPFFSTKWTVPEHMRAEFEHGRYIYVESVEVDNKNVFGHKLNPSGRYFLVKQYRKLTE